MYELIAEYGMVAVALMLAVLTWVAMRLVALIKVKMIRELATRGWDAARAGVSAVAQVYVDELKAAREDGKLTADEKKAAKAKAIAFAKSYLGTKGLKEAAKFFDIDDWLGAKIEAVLGEDKRLGKLQG